MIVQFLDLGLKFLKLVFKAIDFLSLEGIFSYLSIEGVLIFIDPRLHIIPHSLLIGPKPFDFFFQPGNLSCLFVLNPGYFSFFLPPHGFNLFIRPLPLTHQLAALPHDSFFLPHSSGELLRESLNLCIPCPHSLGLVRNEPLALVTVAADLSPRQVLPFSEKLQVVVLSLLLYQSVVVVHLAHKGYMPRVHALHVVLDTHYVLLSKLNRNEPAWHVLVIL